MPIIALISLRITLQGRTNTKGGSRKRATLLVLRPKISLKLHLSAALFQFYLSYQILGILVATKQPCSLYHSTEGIANVENSCYHEACEGISFT